MSLPVYELEPNELTIIKSLTEERMMAVREIRLYPYQLSHIKDCIFNGLCHVYKMKKPRKKNEKNIKTKVMADKT